MVKLHRLITVLGGYGARLVGPRPAGETDLRSVAMHDGTEETPATGDVFLAVGVPDPAEAVRLAEAARAAVLVVRTDPETAAELGTVAAGHRIAVLTADPAVSWSQLAEVVYGMVFEGRETESGRGPSDLFALADTVAAAVGAPVTIEDRLCRVISYSSRQHDADPVRHETILGRRVPEAVRELFEKRGVFTHLANSDAPLFVPAAPEHGLRGRMVIAVRAGRELLGSLWVTCDAPLSSTPSRLLCDSAHTVALHLLRSRVSADLERQVESELVIQLLEAGPDPGAVIGKLGLPPGPARVIAVQAHAGGERHAAIMLAFEHATTGFGWSRPGRSALFGAGVYTVLPCGDDPTPAQDWLAELFASLPAHVDATAGIGAPALPAELAASRREAEESLALHSSAPTTPPVCYDESWDRIVLQRLRTAAASGRTPSRGPIADLAGHDAAHGTEYLPTLRAWLLTQGELPSTAQRLDVHPNTVRHRLRRMGEVTALDLDDPQRRLAMMIMLAAADQEAGAPLDNE
ncbi:PucR family transcriptional regulator [Sciscionella sediminilitoris]|uniref:PucR family transcriptional regulator n=1 Tax=Sciscionella sediminilitoris TaxID=1445613 RepID=UPI0004DF658E|nr:PucR family transcriptional regulator [Sciscionella sp. SE31]